MVSLIYGNTCDGVRRLGRVRPLVLSPYIRKINRGKEICITVYLTDRVVAPYLTVGYKNNELIFDQFYKIHLGKRK